MTTRQRVERITKDALKQVDALKVGSTKEFVAIINKMRQEIVLVIAETGEINPISSEAIKQRIKIIVEKYQQIFERALSDNQRRMFIKGIQVVDKTVTGGGLMIGVPYLSESKLELLKSYNAELITRISDDTRHRIAQEIDLALLGQKPAEAVIKAIGRNLKDPSIFGTVGKRAEVIHRTEVNRIQEIATSDRMKQVSKQIPDLMKEWFHSFRGIPRPGHLALHQTIIKATEKFRLIGENGIYLIDAPLDPSLPVEEVANCGCKALPRVGRFLK
jgi:hypothetical protein